MPPSQAIFTPHFVKIVIEVKLRDHNMTYILWLGINKGKMPVNNHCSNKYCLIANKVQIASGTASTFWSIRIHSAVGNITRLKDIGLSLTEWQKAVGNITRLKDICLSLSLVAKSCWEYYLVKRHLSLPLTSDKKQLKILPGQKTLVSPSH